MPRPIKTLPKRRPLTRRSNIRAKMLRGNHKASEFWLISDLVISCVVEDKINGEDVDDTDEKEDDDDSGGGRDDNDDVDDRDDDEDDGDHKKRTVMMMIIIIMIMMMMISLL
ncbi:hypothetical protein PoB_000636500 [Plakobranchus ocellatus]|uniref:Uncharacterized protein n=1 Tax=Plakobranchus ocellatus TaxID=259542 RepID=A0AAV3YAQ3_9GAST|nr:hypothetical protein PoB_000636500 [Plakobranchus ocellatus]